VRASLEALPIGESQVDGIMQQVAAMLPKERGLSLAEALAEPSPAKAKV
jgi:hypothetical protein